jgi:hypothetical protein
MDNSTVGDHYLFWRPDLGQSEDAAKEVLADVAVVFGLQDAVQQYCRAKDAPTGAVIGVKNGRTGERTLFGVTSRVVGRVEYFLDELEG